MTGQTIILDTPSRRALAKALIDRAPWGAVVNVREQRRTTEQNSKLWAMLSDLSRAQPQGRKHPPETWKALCMHACGWAVQFEMGLNGQPFPVGYRSSRLSKAEMSELIEFIYSYGAEHGVQWTEPQESAA